MSGGFKKVSAARLSANVNWKLAVDRALSSVRQTKVRREWKKFSPEKVELLLALSSPGAKHNLTDSLLEKPDVLLEFFRTDTQVSPLFSSRILSPSQNCKLLLSYFRSLWSAVSWNAWPARRAFQGCTLSSSTSRNVWKKRSWTSLFGLILCRSCSKDASTARQLIGSGRRLKRLMIAVLQNCRQIRH